MNKKLFGILAMLVVAVGLMAAGCGNKSTDSSVTAETPAPGSTGNVEEMIVNDNQTISVTYTNSGFSPKSVTIDVGDTVQFINESSGNFWPAANPHPFHTSVPGFDAKRAIAPGGSYSHTFTKAGTANYHENLNPGIGGSVIVR